MTPRGSAYRLGVLADPITDRVVGTVCLTSKNPRFEPYRPADRYRTFPRRETYADSSLIGPPTDAEPSGRPHVIRRATDRI